MGKNHSKKNNSFSSQNSHKMRQLSISDDENNDEKRNNVSIKNDQISNWVKKCFI